MKKLGLIGLILVLALITACSSNNSGNNSANNSNGNDHNHAANQEEGNSNELTLENDGVDQAAFEEALKQFPTEVPERIVTTSVPLTEMLYLLGVTPVGVPTSTNPIPAEFDSVERIGSPMAPDLEVITKLEADLVLGSEALRSTIDKNLEGLDLNKAYLKTDSFEDLKLSFKVLGTYLNKTEEMNTVLADILAKENELMKLAEGKELPNVLLVIGTSDSFMVMSEGSYVGSLIKRLGAENIATTDLKVTATYSAINMESIVAADPDVILVLASGDHGATKDKFQKEVEKNDAWTKLSAYTNDQIHILDYSVFGVTSILNVNEALTDISKYFLD